MQEDGWQKETLEQAQMTKLDRFIDNAHIKASDHVLEIGTGWGSLAMRAVQRTGCRVTSLTLSVEQKALAEQRIAAAGLTDRIEVLLCDYRALPLPRDEDGKEGYYDKVVSIEMLEAVGEAWLERYFECVDRLLKREGGVGVFQCITMPETVSLNVFASARYCQPARQTHSVCEGAVLIVVLPTALRGLHALHRFHPQIHLPGRPPPHRLSPNALHLRRLQRHADHRQHRKHRSALRQVPTSLERELHGEFRRADKACVVEGACGNDGGRCRAV